MSDTDSGLLSWLTGSFWGPRALFLAGTILLVGVSSYGGPLWTLIAASVAFLLCASVLVVRQLRLGHSTQGGPPGWLIRVAVALCVAGLAIQDIYWLASRRVDFLLLIGLVLLLLGLGWLAEAWRGAPRERATTLLWWGLGLVGFVAATGLVAVSLLPAAKGARFLLIVVHLGVAVLVLLPLGLSLLSEWGLRKLRTRTAIGRIGLYIILLVTVGIVWLVLIDWVLEAVLAAAALALLLALVSNTHLDVALVLAGLCLIAAAPPEEAEPVALTSPVGKRILVAMGDSYMSGEGAETFFKGTDDSGGNECRRAPSAYAVKAATVKDARFDRLVFIACSGARTYNVLESSKHPQATPQPGETFTQIDQLKRREASFRPALVIISVGGNDAGFSALGSACLAPGDCSTEKVKKLFLDNLKNVQQALTETYKSLKENLPRNVPIVAVPYPQPFAEKPRCSGVALTGAERDFITKFLIALNEAVHNAATAAGIEYLSGMENAFEHSKVQLCQARKGNAGVNFVDISSVNGLAEQRFSPAKWIHNSLHPNERGHDALLGALDTWLNEHEELLDPPQVTQGAETPRSPMARSEASEPKPQCSMTDTGDNNCRTQVSKWARQQLNDKWGWGLVVLVGLAILWAACIAATSLLPGHGNSAPATADPAPDQRTPTTRSDRRSDDPDETT
ncbi:SGNH/GDSL hydrolase family protein [Streptomyces sp. NPDC056257]|uniref:SGNH/GDSL hydrolase family protein n=1 Tax=Streptomyces sp. NPDC056257 TaxID=3345765 RepID=UPI0035D7A0C1